jgi:hypothetical protein
MFTDEEPLSPADAVAPAQRSAAANGKARSARTADRFAVHNFEDLLAELGHALAQRGPPRHRQTHLHPTGETDRRSGPSVHRDRPRDPRRHLDHAHHRRDLLRTRPHDHLRARRRHAGAAPSASSNASATRSPSNRSPRPPDHTSAVTF